MIGSAGPEAAGTRSWRSVLPAFLRHGWLVPAAASLSGAAAWAGIPTPDATGGALPAAAAGLQSSSVPALDFRANGFALPMYALLAVAAAVFATGLHAMIRRWGGMGARPARGVLRRLIEMALLQRRLARRASSGWIHLTLFWGFAILAAGSLAVMLDAYLLQPLGLSPARGGGYKIFQAALDAAGIALLFGCSLALYRRAREPREGAERDARMVPVLLVLLILGISGFLLEGLRIRIEGKGAEPWSFAGSAVAGMIGTTAPPPGEALAAYRLLWWGHAVLALGLLATLPYTRLRHALTSPLNIALSAAAPSATPAMPFDLRTLRASGSFDVKVGVDDAGQLGPRDRLALAACADSGLCREACPAYLTGTPLSPQSFVRRLRDASESMVTGNESGPAIFDGILAPEEVWSCTLCGACARACPVLVDPLRPIVELRRGLVAANKAGKSRSQVLENLSRTGNPFGLPAADRRRVASELGLPEMSRGAAVDLVYWIGCAATFDARSRRIAEATVAVLKTAGIRAGVLGGEELCTGDPARRIGEEGLFQDLAYRNMESFERRGVRKILTHCAHCYNAFRNDYAALGARLEVIHHSDLLRELIEDGRIRPSVPRPLPATLHDACYLARFNGRTEAPRAVLKAVPGLRMREMARRGEETFCCGGGGGQYWYEVARREKPASVRLGEARSTGAGLLVSECPYCLKMFEDSRQPADGNGSLEILDIAEVVAASLAPGHDPARRA